MFFIHYSIGGSDRSHVDIDTDDTSTFRLRDKVSA